MRIPIFLAGCKDDSLMLRNQLLSILLRAGLEVIDGQEAVENENLLDIQEKINQAICSVHVLSGNYGATLKDKTEDSISKFQFQIAEKKLQNDPDNFKMFIWYPPEVLNAEKDNQQEQFISEVRNNISQNMVFTNIASPIQLVDDIRYMLAEVKPAKFDVKSTDVFLIFNELDENEAAEITEMLSDIIDLEKLNIVQDSDMNYSEYCSQQMKKSKLAVIYFKESADWALPFSQQVWKKVGGAMSKTPILLIGDDDPETNLNKKLKVPKIISLIVSGTLIPLEIKVQYDKVLELIEGV